MSTYTMHWIKGSPVTTDIRRLDMPLFARDYDFGVPVTPERS